MSDPKIIIQNCISDHGQQFVALQGITTPDQGATIIGLIQLYSKHHRVSQFVDGFAAHFMYGKVGQISHPVNLFSFATKNSNTAASCLNVIELQYQGVEYSKFRVKSDFSTNNQDVKDFPLFIHSSLNQGLLYVLSKEGRCIIFDLIVFGLLSKQSASNAPIFEICGKSEHNSLLVLNRRGCIFEIKIDSEQVPSYIAQNCKHIQNCQEVSRMYAQKYLAQKSQGMEQEENQIEYENKEDYLEVQEKKCCFAANLHSERDMEMEEEKDEFDLIEDNADYEQEQQIHYEQQDEQILYSPIIQQIEADPASPEPLFEEQEVAEYENLYALQPPAQNQSIPLPDPCRSDSSSFTCVSCNQQHDLAVKVLKLQCTHSFCRNCFMNDLLLRYKALFENGMLNIMECPVTQCNTIITMQVFSANYDVNDLKLLRV